MQTLTKNNSAPVAIITGGAKRIGAAVSAHLASIGYTVVIHFNTSIDAAKTLVEDLKKSGGSAISYQADLTAPKAASLMIDTIIGKVGRLDLLVNSAAVYTEDDADLATLAKMKLVNYDAPVVLINKAAKHLRKNNGSVVNIADVAAVTPFERARAYSKTKAALLQLTQKLAKELLCEGVRVNAICPGTILWAEGLSKEKKERILNKIPMKHIGTPQDIAKAIEYLAGASYVTGQIISIDGGLILSHMF